MTLAEIARIIIEEKAGIPPFVAWSGPPKSENPTPGKYGDPSAKITALEAVEKIADFSSFGRLIWGQRIVDSQGKIVFDVNNSADCELLKASDEG